MLKKKHIFIVSLLVLTVAVAIFRLAPRNQDAYELALAADRSGNAVEAVRLYEKAAEGGSTDAMAALGVIYVMRGPKPINRERGEYWLKRCALKDQTDCQTTLGLLYYAGYGAPSDIPRAIEWLERASAGGDAEAKVMLGNVRAGRFIVPTKKM